MTNWTTPITWGTADPTVSQFNQQIRDNENHLYERAKVYLVPKTADESRNTTTTLANDSELFWVVAANEVWKFKLFLYATDASNGGSDIKIGWSVPASTTMSWGSYNTSTGGSFVPAVTTSAPTTPASESTSQSWGLNNLNLAWVHEGLVFVSSTAGTVFFQWAQNASSGSNVTVKKGTCIELFKVV